MPPLIKTKIRIRQITQVCKEKEEKYRIAQYGSEFGRNLIGEPLPIGGALNIETGLYRALI